MVTAVEDCLLSKTWSDWGQCSVQCGLGIKERHRRIIQYPRNGGQPCRPGDTVQRAVCEGTTCKVPRALSAATISLLRGATNLHNNTLNMPMLCILMPLGLQQWTTGVDKPVTDIATRHCRQQKPMDGQPCVDRATPRRPYCVI